MDPRSRPLAMQRGERIDEGRTVVGGVAPEDHVDVVDEQHGGVAPTAPHLLERPGHDIPRALD